MINSIILDSEKFIVRLLNDDDLAFVSTIHRQAFPKSALTALGDEAVRRYYFWQLRGPHEVHAIGVDTPSYGLIGFCFAGSFRGALSGYMQKNWKFLLIRLLTHPWLLLHAEVSKKILVLLKSSQIFPKNNVFEIPIKKEKKKLYGVLSIGVNPLIQGRGVGKILMNAVEQTAIQKGYVDLVLSVAPTNVPAIKFYEKNGWKKVIDESNTWTGRMEKQLSKLKKEDQS